MRVPFGAPVVPDVYSTTAISVGEIIDQGKVFGSIEAVKTVSDLNMPATGEVLELNDELNDHPELVNNDPYGQGWIIKIAISNQAELDNLLDAEQYQAIL